MHTDHSFLNSVILLGALQGFIISVLLFLSGKKHPSNKLLAGVLFLLAWASLKIYLNSQNWFSTSSTWSLVASFVPFFVIMPVGPLLYFYTQSLSDPNFVVTARHRRHFIPVIIDFVPHLTAIVFVAGYLLHVFKKDPAWANFVDSYYIYSDIPRWVSMTIYLSLTARYLSALKRSSHTQGNDLPAGFNWLRMLNRAFLVFQAIWLLHLVPYVIPRFSDLLINTVDWFPLYIPVTILIYWLGIRGFVMAQRPPVHPAKKKTTLLSTLTANDIEQAVLLLKRSMHEDKLYLDPSLNLGSLAAHTGIPAKTISTVLNQCLEKSFNEFINGYRIEALKEKIQQPAMSNLTIAGIAFECGFNSQATFQRTFKDFTGMSPSEFRKNAERAFEQ
jgi:AraC-like DNA-binding protein